jgi:glycosyltransferase involved in cell wall biosynthesis
MTPPTVTVLLTVYNAGRFFDAAIASIVNQTFRDWEFLIVDDASTDGSLDVARAWATRDGRIRVLENPANKGQTPCLNQGLRAARGEWLARQDADDLSHPERLARQLAAADGLALLGTNGWIIDADDRVTGLLDAPLTHESITWTAPFLNPFMHTAVLARTAVLRDELGGYDETFRIAQDYDLWTRLLARHRTANLPDRLVSYRHLATSLSKAGSGRAFAEARTVADREADRQWAAAMTAADREVIAAFREGRLGPQRREFWALYRRLRARRADAPDLRRTAALHHLKVAGAMVSPVARATEITAALRSDPGTTVRWLTERLAAGRPRG